jgi:pyridoxine 5-phosphate synthase
MKKIPILLGVNIDHVATLRQARFTDYPDPVQAALAAEKGGADSITLHLREDRRHIQERDVYSLKEAIHTPMNLEMAMTDEMVLFAEKVQPEYCCIVPEKRQELTTEGGLDVMNQLKYTSDTCKRLGDAGIRVSLFIDADVTQINAAADAGAKVIELHTGHYADAKTGASRTIELHKILEGVRIAKDCGLQVNAGHGLNCENVQSIAAIDEIQELNIGHSIVARSVFVGISEAVMEIKKIMLEVRQ